MKASSISETELKNAFLKAAPQTIANIRFFRRHIMFARNMKSGVAGQCDIYGFIWRTGKSIEIELKAADGVPGEDQLAWERFCKAWGILHMWLQAKREESLGETIARWVGEVRSLVDTACPTRL